MKKIKCWNTGDVSCLGYCDEPNARASVGAYSREDARRMIEEYCGVKPSVSELRDYWSPVWGLAMEGIEPERGLWIQWDWKYAPEKVYPFKDD